MFLTNTAVDNLKDFTGQPLGGLLPGLVSVYDESPGYMAVTEFCARVAAAADGFDVVWLDPRNHLRDSNFLHQVPDLTGNLLIISPPAGVNTAEFQSLLKWMAYGSWQMDDGPKVLIVDSLPAIQDITTQTSVVAATLNWARALCQEQQSLLLVGNYGVSGPEGMKALCNRQLNASAHTQVRVRHDGNKFGVAVPMCRHGLPQHEFEWDDALIVVGE